MIPARTRTLPCTMQPKPTTTSQSESASLRVSTSSSLSPSSSASSASSASLRDFLHAPHRVRAARPRVFPRLPGPLVSPPLALGTDRGTYPQVVTRAGPARCDVRETIQTTKRLAASTASVLVSHVHTSTNRKSAVLQICQFPLASRARASQFFDIHHSYLRRLQEAAAASASAQRGGVNGISGNANHNSLITGARISSISPSTMSIISSGPHSLARRSPPTRTTAVAGATGLASTILASAQSASFLPDPVLNSHAPVPISPSRYPIAADAPYNQAPPTIYSISGPFDRPSTADTISSAGTTSGQVPPSSAITPSNLDSNPFAHSYGLYQNWNGPGSSPYPFKLHQYPSPSYLPPLNCYYRPHRPNDIAPREMLLQIIQLFFDFVYPLTPCIHRPSFMADLSNRREERDPLFFALVMSTIAATLVQVPRSYLPLLERREVRRLAQICHEASRHVTIAAYDPPTSTHVVIRYL